MPKPQLVRVKLENGREATVGAGFAESHDLEVLDKPAGDRAGKARRPKPRTSIAEAVDSKKTNREGSDSSASSEEESK